MENKKWYAVMIDRQDDDWGIGSFDFEEAQKMVVNNTTEDQKDGYIAVIENGTCIKEITPDDFDPVWYSAYRINQAKDWGFLDEDFERLAYWADMSEEWATVEPENVDDVIQKIFDKLGITLN